MKTRNLLITNTSKYTRIFQIRNDARVCSIYFQKYLGDTELTFTGTPLTPFDFPDPITYNILFRLLYMYLRTQHFEEASDLLVINRKFAFAVYRQIYGKFEPNSILVMISRLSYTFRILQAFYDEYLSERNYSLETNVAIRLERRSIYTVPLAPWDFYPSVILEGHANLTVPQQPVNTYCTGRNFGDIVQVIGASTQGVVEATQIHHPVFTVILGTLSQSLIPNESDFWHNRYFKKFTNLLRVVFGNHSGVYFMVNPVGIEESPFITQSDTFIRFQ